MKVKVKKLLKNSKKENSLKSFPINAKIKPCERKLIKKHHVPTK